MLAEGVHPVSLERAATQAGYPVGTLQLTDELNMELMAKIAKATADAADARRPRLGAAPRHRRRREDDRARPRRRGSRARASTTTTSRPAYPTCGPASRRSSRSRSEQLPLAGHEGPDALRRGARDREVLRGGRHHLRRRRQHRLDHGHRLPAQDRRRGPVHDRLRGRPTARSAWRRSWRAPTSSPRRTATGSGRRRTCARWRPRAGRSRPEGYGAQGEGEDRAALRRVARPGERRVVGGAAVPDRQEHVGRVAAHGGHDRAGAEDPAVAGVGRDDLERRAGLGQASEPELARVEHARDLVDAVVGQRGVERRLPGPARPRGPSRWTLCSWAWRRCQKATFLSGAEGPGRGGGVGVEVGRRGRSAPAANQAARSGVVGPLRGRRVRVAVVDGVHHPALDLAEVVDQVADRPAGAGRHRSVEPAVRLGRGCEPCPMRLRSRAAGPRGSRRSSWPHPTTPAVR